MGVFEKIFGTRSQREIKKIQPTVDKILALEDEYKALSEEALKAKTAEFKNRLDQGETLDDLLPEAFANLSTGPEQSMQPHTPPLNRLRQDDTHSLRQFFQRLATLRRC